MMNKENLDKKYFSISEVSSLCKIKPHTLRFWEKEFSHLKPLTRKGSRRYYQKKDIEYIKQIHYLLYEEGMTIAGAKKNLKSLKNKDLKEDTSIAIVQELEGLLKEIK